MRGAATERCKADLIGIDRNYSKWSLNESLSAVDAIIGARRRRAGRQGKAGRQRQKVRRLVVGAANTHGGAGRADLVSIFVVLTDGAGNRAERAFGQREKTLVVFVVGLARIDVSINAHLCVGPHRKQAAIRQRHPQFRGVKHLPP